MAGPQTQSQGLQALVGRQQTRGYWRPRDEDGDPGLVLSPLAWRQTSAWPWAGRVSSLRQAPLHCVLRADSKMLSDSEFPLPFSHLDEMNHRQKGFYPGGEQTRISALPFCLGCLLRPLTVFLSAQASKRDHARTMANSDRSHQPRYLLTLQTSVTIAICHHILKTTFGLSIKIDGGAQMTKESLRCTLVKTW